LDVNSRTIQKSSRCAHERHKVHTMYNLHTERIEAANARHVVKRVGKETV